MRRLSTTTGSPVSRRAKVFVTAVFLSTILIGLVVPAGVAGATDSAPRSREGVAADAEQGQVDVVKVSGLLDPILADLVISSVDRAEAQGSVALVLQLNSADAVVSDSELTKLGERLHRATIPVAIWVGPSGAKATGRVAQLLGVVPIVGVAPGSTVGDAGDTVLPERLLRKAYLEHAAALRRVTMGSEEALKAGVATVEAPVIVDMVGRLPGVPSHVEQEPTPHRVADVTPVFSQLPLVSQVMHTVASPAAAYLLVVVGLALIVFEMFTAGVGIAGIVGALSLVLGCFGLWVLPTNWVAFAVLCVAFVAYAVDVQTGIPRFWTGLASVLLVAASFTLLDGMRVPWLPLMVGLVGAVVFMVAGMPAMVRTRFSTPTIDRGWLVGSSGEVVSSVDPEGVVSVRDALWKARSADGSRLTAGNPVEVVGVRGVVLEVSQEPSNPA